MGEIYQPGSKEYNGTPRQVTHGTDLFLKLLRQGELPTQSDRDLARRYLLDHTIPLLQDASAGSGRVFGVDGFTQRFIIDMQPPELSEASGYFFVVFANMPEMSDSPFLPMGFSRRGMLQAPQTSNKFKERILGMEEEIRILAAGIRDPHKLLESNQQALLVHSFFHVGRLLSDHLPLTGIEIEEARRELAGESVKLKPEFPETIARRNFNVLLDSIHIDLSHE